MPPKTKGCNAERELIHLFWKHRWAASRVAGSGSIVYPAPDVLAGNNLRRLAIECKVTKDRKQYLTKKEVEELKEFADLFGAEPWVAVKFNNVAWFFLSLDDLDDTGKHLAIGLESAKLRGLSFEDLIRV
ncbi:TPA: Holliday junction resolvase [Candidatus Woesearchaeota archaeon]|nr:Holliday junction resolvase [Candidatus Woesearchaeota archaeon]